MGVTYTTATGATYVPLSKYTAPSTQASITLNSFSGYTDLVITLVARNDTDPRSTYIQYNGDTTNKYSSLQLGGGGTSVTSQVNTSNSTVILASTYATAPSAASNPGIFQINLFNYANSTTNKTCLIRSSSTYGTDAVVALYRSTAAITSILLAPQSGNFATGTTVSVYGILGA